jgi:hypothetical protein
MAMPDPDSPCFTVLASGAVCGHRYGSHYGGWLWPVPDDLQRLLDQREALLATLARVCQGFEGKGQKATADRIRAIYGEELPKASAEYRMPPAPVMAEVIETVADALERVRRAKCVDGDVRDALDAVRT